MPQFANLSGLTPIEYVRGRTLGELIRECEFYNEVIPKEEFYNSLNEIGPDFNDDIFDEFNYLCNNWKVLFSLRPLCLQGIQIELFLQACDAAAADEFCYMLKELKTYYGFQEDEFFTDSVNTINMTISDIDHIMLYNNFWGHLRYLPQHPSDVGRSGLTFVERCVLGIEEVFSSYEARYRHFINTFPEVRKWFEREENPRNYPGDSGEDRLADDPNFGSDYEIVERAFGGDELYDAREWVSDPVNVDVRDYPIRDEDDESGDPVVDRRRQRDFGGDDEGRVVRRVRRDDRRSIRRGDGVAGPPAIRRIMPAGRGMYQNLYADLTRVARGGPFNDTGVFRLSQFIDAINERKRIANSMIYSSRVPQETKNTWIRIKTHLLNIRRQAMRDLSRYGDIVLTDGRLGYLRNVTVGRGNYLTGFLRGASRFIRPMVGSVINFLRKSFGRQPRRSAAVILRPTYQREVRYSSEGLGGEVGQFEDPQPVSHGYESMTGYDNPS